ncbi:SPOR domain-containing protein [Gloeocapsopsis crepidinum LEGE 06123]|uniref:SPOR domain-containing protein n=1 Tax=Gloeocapsopsis crepidinum LEGE 06123 TaxID=588587 RepID=A0ABR9UKI3_9CHRO|nr:SPOR domain-containing protein [Gloeocapsopsis crepidinum]MBE9188796.1 SPOR domain-containing protein [Gloeocapsopsis crepidinum LEGE 06123]
MKTRHQLCNASLFAQLTNLSLIISFAAIVLGGWFTTANKVALASQDLISQAVDRLPPPPQTPDGARQSPASIFVPREFDFQAPSSNTPPRVNTPSSDNLSYLVYVDDASSPTLEQVKQLEPQAFVRQYNGRAVVQAGAFEQNSNAEQRAQELKSAGVVARIANLNTGTDTAFTGDSRTYYVVIPDRRESLPAIADQIRQLQQNVVIDVSQRTQPRGPHVRVGPFSNRSLAEQWNQFFLNSGLSNARVYYGR